MGFSSDKIAVVMSVYRNDEANNLRNALDSLVYQSYENFDVFLMVDGPISDSLGLVISEYSLRDNFFVYKEDQNRGLAFQINKAISIVIKTGSYPYIARMDADDISHKDRFLKQIKFFNTNPGISVLGTSVLEFGGVANNFIKKMPTKHTELLENIIRRCPMNHPTVMFNRRIIRSEDLKYDDKLMNTQDYYLWVDLFSKGYEFANLDEVLLNFRVDSNFHSRRGFKKALNDFKSRIYAMRKLKAYTFVNITHTVFLFFLRVSPSFVKKFAYKYLR